MLAFGAVQDMGEVHSGAGQHENRGPCVLCTGDVCVLKFVCFQK